MTDTPLKKQKLLCNSLCDRCFVPCAGDRCKNCAQSNKMSKKDFCVSCKNALPKIKEDDDDGPQTGNRKMIMGARFLFLVARRLSFKNDAEEEEYNEWISGYDEESDSDECNLIERFYVPQKTNRHVSNKSVIKDWGEWIDTTVDECILSDWFGNQKGLLHMLFGSCAKCFSFEMKRLWATSDVDFMDLLATDHKSVPQRGRDVLVKWGITEKNVVDLFEIKYPPEYQRLKLALPFDSNLRCKILDLQKKSEKK